MGDRVTIVMDDYRNNNLCGMNARAENINCLGDGMDFASSTMLKNEVHQEPLMYLEQHFHFEAVLLVRHGR